MTRGKDEVIRRVLHSSRELRVSDVKITRALLSVSDKTGLEELARGWCGRGGVV
jgi:hypothetical protein